MGTATAPVVGSGSCPAWMQSVAKAMLAPGSGGTARAGEELPALAGGEGTAEQITLHAVAVPRGQELELLLGLHALRDHLQLQGVREGDDGGGDGGVVGVGGDVAYERLVDLQGVDGEPLQVAERRVPDPEVVDGDPYPDSLQLAQGE